MVRKLTAQQAATWAQEQKSYWAADVVAISRDGYVLFVTRPKDPQKGFFAIPGGMVKPEEDYGAAAKREYWEETGRKLPEGMKPCAAGLFDEEGRDPRSVPIKSHAFCYVFDEDANDMPLKGEEDLNARWVPFTELKDTEFYADHREVLFGLLKAAGEAVPNALTSFYTNEIAAAVDHCVSSQTEIDELLKATPDGPILCVVSVVSSADKKSVLLVEGPEEPKLLSLLGGIIKPTETPWETCLRKLKETGISLEDVAARPALFFNRGERSGVGIATFVHWVEVDQRAATMPLIAGGAKWVDVNEIPANNFFAGHRDMLMSCLEAVEVPAAAPTGGT